MITYEKNEIYFTDYNVKCRLLFYGKSSGERNLCFTKSCKGKEALQNRKRQSQPSCYKWLNNKKNKKIWSHKAKAKRGISSIFSDL